MNLQEAIEQSGATVTSDLLPAVVADEVMLMQLFQNLISNAIKYRGEETPRIHVSAEREEEGWLFAVRDNGVGIDAEDFDQVFGMFKRLHGSEIPGTGMGLALCKKVVGREGGRFGWNRKRPGALRSNSQFRPPSARALQMGDSDQPWRLEQGANADFEEFVSMAAHNLRESLREVASYSQLLDATYAGRLDSDAQVFLYRIREGAARMQSLLADVVDYWATDTGDRRPSRTDMEAVLSQTLLLTDKQITERAAIVTHDPLPAVTGDFETLAKVLHHLIRNAIEYCGTPPPSVHVSSRREGSEWVSPCETTVRV